MLQQFALRISDLLQKKNVIKEEDKEIYVYGLETLLSTVLNTLVALIIGIMAGLLAETVIYLVAFAILRVYSGGYHAKTHYGCILTFAFLYLASMAAVSFCPHKPMMILAPTAAAITLILVFALAPIEHPNRPLVGKEFESFRKLARWVALIEWGIVMAFVFLIPAFMHPAAAISMAMLSVSFILAYAKIIEGKR